MLNLYESQNGISRKVAEIPFRLMLQEFGVRRFLAIQRLLERQIVIVQPEATIETTLSETEGRR